MAQSLGRLVLDMAANTAGFERDMKGISKSAKKELNKVSRELWKAERDLDRARSKVNRLAGAMAALGGVAIAGVGREFRKFAQEADALDKVSRTVSLTVEELQELRFAAEQAAGITGKTLDMAMQRFARRVGEAANDTGELNTIVKELGINLRNADGSLKSQTELLGVFADEIKNAGSEQEALRIAFKLFDSEGARMVALMREGSGAIDELRDQFRRTGATITSDTVEATVRFNDSLQILSQNVKGLRNQFFADLVEPLSTYVEFLATTESGQQQFRSALQELGETAKTIGIILGVGFTAALTKAVAQMIIAEVRVARLTAAKLALAGASQRAAIGMTAFGRAVSIATGPIGIAVAAIGTIVIAAGTARSKIDGFSQSINDLRLEMRSFANEAQALDAFNEFQSQADEAEAQVDRLEQSLARLRENQASGNLPPGAAPQYTAAEIARLESELQSAREAFQENTEKAGEAYEQYIKLGEGADDAAEGIAGATGETQSFDAWLNHVVGSIDRARGASQRYADSMISIAEALFQASTGMRSFSTAGAAGDGLTFGLEDVLDTLGEVRDEMEEIAAIEWNFENLIDSFHPLAGMMRRLGDEIELVNARIESGQMGEMSGMFMKAGMAANAAFGAMMAGVDQTSSEYKKLERAQQLTNVALGIAAILQQGMGDPYTAIPRMVAMAAMVASLGVDAGGISGGSASQRRQETQGTGSVLGDSDAKSESIANAVEMTADATSKLVGINRGMAQSLRQLQEGLSGAANMLARGGDVDFGSLNLDLGTFNNISNDIWDPFSFFSSTKVKDEGIQLLGGAIADMTEGAVANAFQTVKKKGLFGSSTGTATADLDDALNDQLNLIFQSMIDTVESAGEALGIPLDEIERRIAQFEVEAQKISLKDLDGEEQQAELEAVFSRIFDDLASAVIPFIDQFQKIGEGMGDTLVRVATSVQVAEEAIIRLGLNISDSLGPERMAQVSVGLVEAAGGIEQFITDMENFVSKFAPEAQQFAIAESDITRALDQMGIALPEAREGFWNLVQSIDASTEAGQKQIATLLGLADAADTYYSRVEEIQQEREGLERRILEIQGDTAALRQLELETLDESNRALQEHVWWLERQAELNKFAAEISQSLLNVTAPMWAEFNRLNQAMADQIETARRLGASEETMMRLRQLHEAQMQQFVAGLEESISQLANDLFGGNGEVAGGFQSTASAVSSSMQSIRDSMITALEGVQDWLNSSLLSDTSPLVPQERLNEAERQFNEAFALALGGNVDAISDLPGLADQFLSEAGGFFGTSTSDFDAIWMQVRDAMEQVAGMDVPDAGPPTFGQTAAIQTATESTAMSAAEQTQAAWDIFQQIALVSRQTGETPADIARRLGVPLGNMIDLIGGVPEGISGSLEEQFNAVANEIKDEYSKLLDLESIAIMQRDALYEIVDLLGGESGSGEPKDDPLTSPLPGVGDPIVGTIIPVGDGSFTPPPPTFNPGGPGSGIGGGNDQIVQKLDSIDRRLADTEEQLRKGNDINRTGWGESLVEQRTARQDASRRTYQRSSLS